MEFLQTLLASSIIAGLVSALVSYLVSFRLKQLDFANEYYKEIVKKRLQAYELLETPISDLKAVVLDSNSQDQRAYHLLFEDGEDGVLKFTAYLMQGFSHNLWIDENTNDVLEEINQIFYVIDSKIKNKTNEEIIEVGKEFYPKLSSLRFDLENAVKEGLYNLHNIKKALKIKKQNKKRIFYADIDPNN